MKRILGTLAFLVALAGGSVLLAGNSQKADACCDPTCCEKHEKTTASCSKSEQVSPAASAASCSKQ